MRIAVFYNLPSGGAKRAFYDGIKYLHSVGHEVDVHIPSTADENYLPLGDLASGFHVYPMRRTKLGILSSFARYGLPPFLFVTDLERTHKRIAEAINASPCDILFSESDQFTVAPFLFRDVKKPIVYYCQEPLRMEERFLHEVQRSASRKPNPLALKRLWVANWMRQAPKIDRENASHASCILANSYYSRERILRVYGLNSFVSYLGIDTRLFRPLDLTKGNYVLSVGACYANKGFDFVVRALSLIGNPNRPKLVIVANRTDASWEAHLVEMAANLEVELEIKKAVADEELVVLYNQARVFVYGAILEPFGLAPLEAMACRTPVVAVKEGGVRESVVDGQTGILTDRDEQAFAEAVMELLQNEDLRKRMADNGVESVRSFWTWKQAGERLAGHLKRVVAAQQQGGRVQLTEYPEKRITAHT